LRVVKYSWITSTWQNCRLESCTVMGAAGLPLQQCGGGDTLRSNTAETEISLMMTLRVWGRYCNKLQLWNFAIILKITDTKSILYVDSYPFSCIKQIKIKYFHTSACYWAYGTSSNDYTQMKSGMRMEIESWDGEGMGTIMYCSSVALCCRLLDVWYMYCGRLCQLHQSTRPWRLISLKLHMQPVLPAVRYIFMSHHWCWSYHTIRDAILTCARKAT